MDSVPSRAIRRADARPRGRRCSTRSRAIGAVHARRPRAARPGSPGRPRTGSRSRSKRHGLLVRDGDGRFRLGGRLVGLGRRGRRGARAGRAGARRCSQRLSADDRRERAALRARGRPAGVRRDARTAERPARHRAARRGAAARPGLGRQGAPRLGRRRATASTSTPDVLGRGARAGVGRDASASARPGVASVSAPVRARRARGRGRISVSGPAERLGRRSGRRFAGAGARGGRRPRTRSRRARHRGVIGDETIASLRCIA